MAQMCLAATPIPWGTAKGPHGDVVLTSTDSAGAAVLADAELPADVTAITFAEGTVDVGSISLQNRVIAFSGAAGGTTLRGNGTNSVFCLGGASGDWTFGNLSFAGIPATEHAPMQGGAIEAVGGRLTLTNCTFASFRSHFSGGAVSARLMDGDLAFRDCTFTGNACGPYNGTGGAIYASAREGASVRLELRDSRFEGNEAQSGGAVMTLPTWEVGEALVSLEVEDCAFANNAATYNGGALSLVGDATVGGTVFERNRSGVQGGAICAMGMHDMWSDTMLTVRSGTVFRGNSVENNAEWTCGGAVAVTDPGALFVTEGRHVVFEENFVESGVFSYGGAVYLASGAAANLELAGFLANRAEDGGGAVFGSGADATISTCIFSNNTVNLDYGGLGGAVSVEQSELVLSNCTVRGSNGGAVDIYETDAQVVNCVVADNCGGTDISATTDAGGAATLAMRYTSYGTAEASETVAVTTNACISGTGASVYRGTTLYLDSDSKYLPEAAEGLVQEAWDYDAVKYGSRPQGYSMGAYECPTPADEPKVEIVSTEWYHNRGDGLYYPRIFVRYLEGDALRITGLTLTCEGTDHELLEECVAELRTATTPGQIFVFGVNPDKFPVSYDRTKRDGYIIWDDPAEKERVMLFGEYKEMRPLELELEVKGTLRISEVKSVATKTRRNLASALPQTVEVPARFEEFRIGERISGKAGTATNARVWLYGCAALGEEWDLVCELETDAEGRFEAEVPEGFFFFRLEAEVAR